jgi:hypothetical protein
VDALRAAERTKAETDTAEELVHPSPKTTRVPVRMLMIAAMGGTVDAAISRTQPVSARSATVSGVVACAPSVSERPGTGDVVVSRAQQV